MTGLQKPSDLVLMVLILTGYVLILIDVSVVMAALPTIHRDLHFSATGLSWVQNAYTLLFGGLLLLGARVGDVIGRRRTFVAGIVIFTVASLGVGLAQSAVWLIAARAIQGVGAAALAPSTLALLSTTFSEGPDRTRAMAAYGATSGIATSVGYVLGGIFTSALSWRWGFFINVPIGLLAIYAAPRVLQETERHAGEFDAAGAITSTVGVSAVVYGVVRSATAGWTNPTTVLVLGIGLLVLAAFIFNERRAAQPVLPLRLFNNSARAGAYVSRFLFNGALLSFFFFLTQYLQSVHGDSAVLAALSFLPLTLTAFPAAMLTPRLGRRFSNGTVILAGIVGLLIGTAWMSRVSPGSHYLVAIIGPLVVAGIGQGIGLSALTNAGMIGVTAADAGAAGGVVNAAHHLGGAVGLAILTTVFASAGAGTHGRLLLTDRVDAALLGASVLLAVSVVVALATQPLRGRATRQINADDGRAEASDALAA
jgi:EmrB/QacA subfamily drug resistance transporter